MNRTLFALILGAAAGFSTSASAQWFARPEVVSIKPTSADYSRSTGGGLVFGDILGSQSQHEVSAEIYYAKWSFSEGNGTESAQGHEKMSTVLVNYRYHVRDSDVMKNTSFYIGPSVGASKSDVSATFSNFTYNGYSSDSDSDWRFSWSVSAGFLVHVANRVDIDVGYRYVATAKHSYTLYGEPLQDNNVNTNVFYAGVGVRF